MILDKSQTLPRNMRQSPETALTSMSTSTLPRPVTKNESPFIVQRLSWSGARNHARQVRLRLLLFFTCSASVLFVQIKKL